MKTVKSGVEVIISSPPERDVLVSELWVGTELLGEIFSEKGALQLTLYPPRTGSYWSLDAHAVLTGLQAAISELPQPQGGRGQA